MAQSVPVRCPVCRREHHYVPPAFPCPCGASVVPPVDRAAAVSPLTHRTWSDEWVSVRCAACGRQDEWPRPETGCSCGTVLRLPVLDPRTEAAGPVRRFVQPAHIPLPHTAAAPRPPFRPVAIRTAGDAVTTSALYLKWLGYQDLHRPRSADGSACRLDARGLVARIDPSTRPVRARDVECLWLTALAASAVGVCFALAGYGAEARSRADELGVPLFVLDLAGAPQPVNGLADDLVAAGA